MNILDIAIAKKLAGGGGGSGTDNYNDLSNLPKINDTTLSGNKSSSALGLQSEINSDSKLASDLVDDTNQDNKFVTSTEKNTWNGKQNAIDADHKLSSDLVDDANKTNKFVTSTEKNTWNAKQNAIDSDHKLSSSLVSFSTAEAAALASGIDSSKVEQISTNQTNILYSLQTGVKNLFDIGNADISDRFHSSVTKTDTSITISTATDKTWARVAIPVILAAGTYHVSTLITNRTVDTGATTRIAISLNNTGSSQIGGVDVTDNENVDFAFTTPGGTIYLILYANYTATAYNATFTATDFMICTQAAWDQEPNVYRPFAAPNYDLTQLEQQDRNALVEVIDEGAKNLLDFANLVSLKSQHVIVTKTDTTITVTSNDTWGYQAYSLDLPAGKYELSFNATAVSISSGRMFVAVFPGQTAENHLLLVYAESIGAKHGSFEWTGGELNISFYANPSNNQNTNSMTITDVMICTKAEYDISPNYASYALPNTDLTVLEAEDRAALAEEIDAGAKNKFNVSVATAVNGVISNGTFTQDIADTKTNLEFKFIVYSNGAWVNLLEPRAAITITQNGVMSIEFICPPNVTELRFGHNGSPYDSVEVINNISLISGQAYVLQLNILNCVHASGKYSWNNVMICTLADWKISQKYVPYRMSYQDLCDKKASALINTTISSGSLDDVSQNTFAIYSDNVSNLPVNQYCYVETFVIDANFALQKAYSSRNGDAYVRVKASGTWTAWKQCTNV